MTAAPSRRRLLAALGASATGVALAGCSEMSDSDPAPQNDGTPESQAPESLEAVLEIELGRPGEEATLTIDDEYQDQLDEIRIRNSLENGLDQTVQPDSGTASFTVQTAHEITIHVTGSDAGEPYTLEETRHPPQWNWEGLLRNEFELKNGERGLFDSILPNDWEIEHPDNPSKQLERAHIYVQEALGTTSDYQTKQDYPLAMRSAAMNDLEIDPEQLPILRRKNISGTNYIAVPVKGENQQDLGIGFPGEELYLRHDEPVTEDEKTNSVARAIVGYRNDSRSNVFNVESIDELPTEDRTEEEKRGGDKLLSQMNDFMYPVLRDDLHDREWGATSFEPEAAPYIPELRGNNEHVKIGGLLLNNFVETGEYMQTKIADNRDEFREEYGKIVNDLSEISTDSGIAVTTEIDGKVFAITKVGIEEQKAASTTAYRQIEG